MKYSSINAISTVPSFKCFTSDSLFFIYKSNSISGLFLLNSTIIRGKTGSPILWVAPIEIFPFLYCKILFISFSILEIFSKISLDILNNSLPANVNLKFLEFLSINCKPKVDSNFFIWIETADWLIYSFLAAFVKIFSLHASKNIFKWCISIYLFSNHIFY